MISFKNYRIWLALGAFFHFLTAVYNIGFIAIDDYAHGISLYLPAQNHTFQEILSSSGFRSPFPNLFLHAIAKIALALGIEHPISQLRFVNLMVTVIGQLGVLFAVAHFMLRKEDRNKIPIIAFLSCFYFLSPLFVSRPLIESLSLPWITISSFFACAYFVNKKPSLIFLATLTLGVASMFRYQSGICIFALGALLLFKKDSKGLLTLLVSGVIVGMLSGLPDLWWKGKLHSSLYTYVHYNIHHSSDYGVSPFYTYFLVLIGLSIPPIFFSLYRGFNWKEQYHSLTAAFWYFLFFVISHSIVPHKEERFLVPILHLFLILLTPLAYHLLNPGIFKSWGLSFKKYYFFILNTVALFLASFNPPQINTIGFVRYMDSEPQITKIYSLENALVLLPQALGLRKDYKLQERIPVEAVKDPNLIPQNCSELLLVRYDHQRVLEQDLKRYHLKASFPPGPLEQLVVFLNPRKNARRGTLFLYERPECQDSRT